MTAESNRASTTRDKPPRIVGAMDEVATHPKLKADLTGWTAGTPVITNPARAVRSLVDRLDQQAAILGMANSTLMGDVVEASSDNGHVFNAAHNVFFAIWGSVEVLRELSTLGDCIESALLSAQQEGGAA